MHRLKILAHGIFFVLAHPRAFGDVPYLRFWCLHPKLCLMDFLKMLVLALTQISTRVYHSWKSIKLNIALNGDSHSCHFFFFFHLLRRRSFNDVPQSHFEVFLLKDAILNPASTLHVLFTQRILPNWTVLKMAILANVIYLSFRTPFSCA